MAASVSKIHKTNLIAGGVLLLYGSWILREALFTIRNVGFGGEPGPAFLPRIIGVMLVGLSAALLLRTFVQIQLARKAAGAAAAIAPKPNEEKTEGKTDIRSIVCTFALFVFYSVALAPLGYILTSVIFAFLQMLVLSVNPTKRQVILYAFLSIAIPTLLYFLFINIFHLFLPRGILG